ncbi:hypothetical protein CWI37_0543p0010 [Hamiltosporidium tvaerminnensis]|uniref:Uncharacterized protein n=1 Tax=Hamiltosporidium tvaerminnensis TaxID=1176355 RepID=A0A4Q9L3Q8_9MICR|nr:hypothetical protein CWI37_0543p0010 [Hamiltosporidium tvaerminnensis]
MSPKRRFDDHSKNTKDMLLKKEYIERLGELISKLESEFEIEGFERNESISIIEVENELKRKGYYPAEFKLALISKSQVKDMQDQKINMFRPVSSISVASLQEFFHKFLDMYVSCINPRYLENIRIFMN